MYVNDECGKIDDSGGMEASGGSGVLEMDL